ncbi:bifunctional hydroxymethylpyrimidine kinase/phosphomethylpyrimidine kinase [Roseateles flavus]|uniref:Bifunctional hydroxymethylpyrimidine kinase/phosphomethylpyrimidine kinase n=1 Tax=Roseateles flavus TaxID=3149041 RepID=A0ABV0GK15_9BURK
MAQTLPSALPHPCLPSPWFEAPDPALERLPAWHEAPAPPVIWSVAGHDSGGAAGLSADARAAAALGVHLCPVVAAVTAQNSLGVEAVHALPGAQIRAQLAALRQDLTPRVIKTGLLGSVDAVEALLEVLAQLRAQGRRVDLVVDPVLGASAGGAAFCDEALLQACRERLLPAATLITPNRREALRLLQHLPGAEARAGLDVPALAAALRHHLAPQAGVCITGGDDALPVPGAQDLALDWLDLPDQGQGSSPALRGWLALPRLRQAPLHHHGSGCTFASAAAAALARGFPVGDALVLAKMCSWHGLRQGHAAGAGPGPLRPTPDFIHSPEALPVMGFGDETRPDATTLARWTAVLSGTAGAADMGKGLYGIVDDEQGLAAVAGAGLAHLQLRSKTAPDDDSAALRRRIAAAVQCMRGHPGTRFWVNDHWQLALELGAGGIHLGQEDWACLDAAQRLHILDSGAALGLSSHSLWELARARGLAPAYIACGPVWATTTKRMPWLAQGLSQLAWWARMAGRPVVAIGGVLAPEQVEAAARAGASAVCLVRGLAPERLEAYRAAWRAGRRDVSG